MAATTTYLDAAGGTIRSRGRLKPGTVKYTSLYVLLGLYSAFTFVIFVWVALMSMKTNTDVLLYPPWHLPSEWQWRNYVDAWNSGVGTMFRNSAIVTSFGDCTLTGFRVITDEVRD